MDRYNRHIILSEIGAEGQQKISSVSVLVIGAGGLGCPVLQYLAAAGIGTLGIMDFDVVDVSNLQRQVLFGASSLGKNKAVAARDRLLDLNPTIDIIAYQQKLDITNALDLIKKYDVVVDGSDNFGTRYLINDAAILLQKPVVYGAIFKFEGQVSVFNYKGGPSYRCLFPELPEAGTVPNCSEIGVLGVLPGIIGTMQANEVLKLVLEIGTTLSGKLLCYNAQTCQSTILSINRNEFVVNRIVEKGLICSDYQDSTCEHIPLEISLENTLQKNNVQFIDVREPCEEPKIDHPDVIQLPLSTLKENIGTIDTKKVNVVFCQSGLRSKKAVSLLIEHKVTNCYSLQEGAAELLKAIQKKIYMETKYKNVFKQGAISSDFIGTSIAKHQSKTTIGAHNIFLGQVRADQIEGNVVSAIEYTAYEEMANKKFHEIREATFKKFDLTCMHIYHSLGTVAVGEICLFVFVSSPRRKVVFEALEYVVECIKADVPVFGKEIFEDASHQWKVNS